MLRRTDGAANESVASRVHRVRRAAVVLLGRHVRRGPGHLDDHQAHHQQAVPHRPHSPVPVPDVPDGAPEPGTEKRAREADDRVHRPVWVHHGHKSPSRYGQVLKLSQVRTKHGHHAGDIRQRDADTGCVQQSHNDVRGGR